MNMVNIRGLGLSPPVMKGVSPPHYAAFPTYPTAQSSLLLVGDTAPSAPKDEVTTTIKKIEELAQLSYVVYGFAEVKYKQLVPVAPSEEGLSTTPAGVARKPSAETLSDDEDDYLTNDTVIIISEEALVLYVKTLALLNKAMDTAGTYWKKHGGANDSRAVIITDRLNRVVSWLRDRFNECCTKTEIIARKLKTAQMNLPADHPSHPSNQSAASATTVGSTENILLTTGVTAEKLMYERALEMSRSAAIDELTGQNLPGCDINYSTAIAMLEAILEVEEDEGEEADGVEEADRKSIEKSELKDVIIGEDVANVKLVLGEMKVRHRTLRKKLEKGRQASVGKRGGGSAPA